MKLDKLRLGKSALTDKIFVGELNKDKEYWTIKRDITDDFIGAVIDRWAGFKETISTSDGKAYEISVKQIDKATPTITQFNEMLKTL